MLLPQLLKHEILVMVMVMIMTVPDNIAGHTTCLAITTIYNTSVTCLFGEDISKLSFNVQFFFPNTSVDPEMILLCNKLMSGELTCYKGSQVLFDEKKEIVDRFTLSRPPSLTKVSGGYYQCHAVPSLREESHFCPLTYKDVLNFVPLESRCPQPPPPEVGSVVIQTFTMVAVVIVMIIAGVYLWTKRKSVFVWWSRRTAQSPRPGDVEGRMEHVERFEMCALCSERQQRKELHTGLLLKNYKDQDEDEGDEWYDTRDEHRPNPQSPQQASPYTQPVTATTDSHQYPATSPVPPETQPSVRETSMPPCLDIEDPPVEKGTDVLEDETLMSEELEAEPNMGEHEVGDEIEMDKKAKREKLKADKKAKEEELKADKKAKKKKKEEDKKAKKKEKEADEKAKKKKKEEDKKAKKKKKEADKKAGKDQNRDRRGSQREEDVMGSQESSNEHEMHTVV